MKGQVILKNLQWLGRHNPAFTPGSVQTAVAELLNPTSSILPYSGRLCLDKPAIVCTGTKYFNIDAGATKNVNFQILMPTAEGTYPVHLDIFSNSELIEAYRAAEDVVIAKEPIPPPGEVKLKRGGNYVVYTGKAQSAEAAFASIASYVTVVYYYNNAHHIYEIPITMVPYGCYWIKVTRDCTWTYGAEATAPSSVQLYTGTNLVAYLGPTQNIEAAIASILPYFEKAAYYVSGDRWLFYTPGMPSDLQTMVNREAYFISVNRACRWFFS